MVTPEFAVTMARYNRWQNRSVIAAAQGLTDADRWQDRGAFFRSIAETLNHVLWDDRIWLARLRGDHRAVADIAPRHPYTDAPADWSDYVAQRGALDEEIIAWVDLLKPDDFSTMIAWQRGNEPVHTTLGFNFVHMINHQTHHRGQVHLMLTQAGAKTGSTDLPMLDSD